MAAITLPAAFGRLCVETLPLTLVPDFFCQPPSGGCVLKPNRFSGCHLDRIQPPSGGCVLKLNLLLIGGFGQGPSRLRAAVC